MVYALAQHVRPFINDDGAVLLNIKTGKYYSLNPIGARLCVALKAGTPDTESLAAIVASEYRIDLAQAVSDTNAFLQQLSRHNLLEQRSGGDRSA
jgi:hypothetical protein